jgi:hypothetical protein
VREEEEVLGALPQATRTLFSFRGIQGWSRLALMLIEKWAKPYSEVCGYVNAPISIAIVRATHLCVCGSRIPTSKMSKRLPQWKTKQASVYFIARNLVNFIITII